MNILQTTTRSKFEQFAIDEGMNVKTEKSGGYQSATTNRAYLAWLAAKRMYEVEPMRVSQHEAMTEQDARIAQLTARNAELEAEVARYKAALVEIESTREIYITESVRSIARNALREG